MRQVAQVENHIGWGKASGLCRFPLSDLEANADWMAVVMLATDLVRWLQLICLDGYWSTARSKSRRWGLLRAPGRIVRTGGRSVVRLLEHRPGSRSSGVAAGTRNSPRAATPPRGSTALPGVNRGR